MLREGEKRSKPITYKKVMPGMDASSASIPGVPRVVKKRT